jgi:hypothetical protein
MDSSKKLEMGIEPSKLGVKTQGFGKWRYRRYSFFASSFPFFFLREIRFHTQNLSGENTYESKIRSRRIRKGTITKIKAINRETREMPTMWLNILLERWTQRRTLRTNTTLHIQRMHLPILNLVIVNSISSFFIFSKSFLNLSRRKDFEDFQ